MNLNHTIRDEIGHSLVNGRPSIFSPDEVEGTVGFEDVLLSMLWIVQYR